MGLVIYKKRKFPQQWHKRKEVDKLNDNIVNYYISEKETLKCRI